MFILLKIWVIGNNSIIHHYLKKKILDIENITDADYARAKKVRKNFEIKNLGKYHDFYVQSDALLLALEICVS